MSVEIGCVSTFKNPKADKEQAMKIIEEAAEVFGAWQTYNENEESFESGYCASALLHECADVIQATCNFLAGLGVTDFTGYMASCKINNRYRGREYEDTKLTFTKEIKEQMVLC